MKLNIRGRPLAQDPMPQTVKQAQAALGALLDTLQAQQELQSRRRGTGAAAQGPAAQDLDTGIASTAEDLLQLGELDTKWM